MRTIEHWIGGRPTSGNPAGTAADVVTERRPAVSAVSAASYPVPTST